MFATTLAPRRQPKRSPPWAALLERFYTRARRSPPVLRELKPSAVPQPYHHLLVHSSDMTPRLEGFYRQPLGLTVLSREVNTGDYLREVILWFADEARPVEYGVIRICLDQLPPEARRRVLEEQRPLGNILQQEGIPHLSWPQAFFRVKSDAHVNAVLRLPRPCMLYGRRNVLLDGSRRLLAEVIEVLAPADESPMNTL
jgi:chorismate-pyruvate lyase